MNDAVGVQVVQASGDVQRNLAAPASHTLIMLLISQRTKDWPASHSMSCQPHCVLVH